MTTHRSDDHSPFALSLSKRMKYHPPFALSPSTPPFMLSLSKRIKHHPVRAEFVEAHED